VHAPQEQGGETGEVEKDEIDGDGEAAPANSMGEGEPRLIRIRSISSPIGGRRSG
jgi:hypothetical protein